MHYFGPSLIAIEAVLTHRHTPFSAGATRSYQDDVHHTNESHKRFESRRNTITALELHVQKETC